MRNIGCVVFWALATIAILKGQPSNDNCSGAISIMVTGTTCTPATYSNINATASGTSACGGAGDRDIWFKGTLSASNTECTVKFGSLPVGIAAIDIYDACSGNLFDCFGVSPNQSYLITGLIAGATYYFRVSKPMADPQGNINICVWQAAPPPPSNDDCSGAITLTMNTGTCSTSLYSNVGWTSSGTTGCGPSGNGDIWFVTTSTQSEFTVKIGSLPTNTVRVQVFDACGGNQVFCVIAFPNTSYLVVTAPGTYLIRIAQTIGDPQGDIGLCIWQSAPLPLQSLPITVKALFPHSNQITWQCNDDNDRSHYDIEYSQSGISFEHVGTIFVTPKLNKNQSYSFVHQSLTPGIHYYRIKQVDLDGSVSYSNIASVSNQNSNKSIRIFPNPTSGIVTIEGLQNADATVVLRNPLGQVISERSIEQNTLDLSAYCTGLYTLQVISGTQVFSERILKQ